MIRFGDFVRRAERQHNSEDVGDSEATAQLNRQQHRSNNYSSMADAADRFLVSTTKSESSYGGSGNGNDESEAAVEESGDGERMEAESSQYNDATELEMRHQAIVNDDVDQVQSENGEEVMEIEETGYANEDENIHRSESSSLNESLAEQSRMLTHMLNEDTVATFNGRPQRTNNTNIYQSEISVSQLNLQTTNNNNTNNNEGSQSELKGLYQKCMAIRREEGVDNYVCSECQYETTRHSRLKEHLAMHCEEKRFKCSECGYASRWNKDLRRHLRTRHCMGP